jgi:cysteinyl-tRNA synthetase
VQIHDTLRGEKVELVTREPGKVAFYVCGPTVYDVPHVGHARSALSFDIIRRALEWRGYEVTHVSNVTDVDDKIIARAHQEGTSEPEVAAKYEAVYWEQLDRLGVKRPHHTPHATGYVPEMLELVQRLLDKGSAYVTESGVYFSVEGYPGYGELSGRRLSDLLESAGARVEVDERKRSPVDFALWKTAKEGEPSWDSPWGRGRPGWHIECSAMSVGLLGEEFDIHGGGDDLVFPHHENERAQAEGAGQRFARYWLHNAMVMVGGEKMAKSLGNFTTLADALEAHGPRALRTLVLQTHYRSPMEVGPANLADAKAALDRLDALARRARVAGMAETDERDEPTTDAFAAALDDDFNTPAALGALFEWVSERHRRGDEPVGRDDLVEMLSVLGLENLAERDEQAGPEEQQLLEQRQAARARGEYADADRIRDELRARGWEVRDGSAGPQLVRVER